MRQSAELNLQAVAIKQTRVCFLPLQKATTEMTRVGHLLWSLQADMKEMKEVNLGLQTDVSGVLQRLDEAERCISHLEDDNHNLRGSAHKSAKKCEELHQAIEDAATEADAKTSEAVVAGMRIQHLAPNIAPALSISAKILSKDILLKAGLYFQAIRNLLRHIHNLSVSFILMLAGFDYD